jgi:hypothetical protein
MIPCKSKHILLHYSKLISNVLVRDTFHKKVELQHNGKNKEENAIIYKTLHSELQIEKHEPHKKPRENIGSSEKSAVWG